MLDTYRTAAPNGRPLTRTERVKTEGREAARRGSPPHDNPYRFGSADGVAWREGYDEASAKG